MMVTQAAAHAVWFKHWLYDWDGANVRLFFRINSSLPEHYLWLPRLLTWVGSYFAVPFVALAVVGWARLVAAVSRRTARSTMLRFAASLTLALSVGAMAKQAFRFPRPSLVLGDHLVRSAGPVDSLYSFPSGHSLSVAVLAIVLWPLANRTGKVTLIALAAGVGWSRIALGAHFPADVIGGYIVGLASAIGVSMISSRTNASLRRHDD